MANDLTRQYYTRGGQGTLVYSPDIAVFVQTQENGLIDLSKHIVSFTLNRTVNDVSTFSCTFDNKYAVFDRRVRRMDRIVVFLKRISWMQVFSGYIVEAPWQTVVPGDASLVAECTLKRLKHSYFDPWSAATQELFPFFNAGTDWNTADGGVGATLVRLLTEIAQWDMSQIQIQKIPLTWVQRAAKLIKKLAKNEDDETHAYQQIEQTLNNLFDAMGWQGYINGDKDWLSKANQPIPQVASAGVGQFSAAQWVELVGKTGQPMVPAKSGNVAKSGGFIDIEHADLLFSVKVNDTTVTIKDSPIYLRLDAADALAKMLKAFGKPFIGEIEFAYLPFDKAKEKWLTKAGSVPSNNAPDEAWVTYVARGNQTGIIAPVNSSDFVYGTAIKVKAGGALATWLNAATTDSTKKFGWQKLEGTSNVYVFRGTPVYWDAVGRPADQATLDEQGTGAGANLANTGGPTTTFSGTSVFSFMFYYPGLDFESDALLGTRAWINDVPLLDFIKKVAGASQRDFMSAPNGDFIAFFPDRLGQYTNFPSLQVRDIEVVDFKAVVNDQSLTTHYISFGDMLVPTGPENHSNLLDSFLTGAMLTVEQPDVLKYLLGLPSDEAADFGSQLVQMFGIRPKVEQSYYIRNRAYNFAVALHKFQEMWANQWRFLADFTFLPEIYPGMRIELVDREPNPMAVYVESVTHFGNRTSGFTTSVVVSTPTILQNGKWVIMKPEIAPDSPFLPKTETVIGLADDAATKQDMFEAGFTNFSGINYPGSSSNPSSGSSQVGGRPVS